MRRPRLDYPPGDVPPGWAWHRWRVLLKPRVALMAGVALVLIAVGVIAVAATGGGRYVDARIAAIDAETKECTLTWRGAPTASASSTLPCPDGAELGAPVRVYADALGTVYTSRGDAIGLAWFLVATSVGMVGMVAFALATPDAPRWDGSVWSAGED